MGLAGALMNVFDMERCVESDYEWLCLEAFGEGCERSLLNGVEYELDGAEYYLWLTDHGEIMLSKGFTSINISNYNRETMLELVTRGV